MAHPDLTREHRGWFEAASSLIDVERLASLNRALTGIHSPTGRERAASEYMTRHLAGIGLDAWYQPMSDLSGNAIGCLRGRGGGCGRAGSFGGATDGEHHHVFQNRSGYGFGRRTRPREQDIDMGARLNQSGDSAGVGDGHRDGPLADFDSGGQALGAGGAGDFAGSDGLIGGQGKEQRPVSACNGSSSAVRGVSFSGTRTVFRSSLRSRVPAGMSRAAATMATVFSTRGALLEE